MQETRDTGSIPRLGRSPGGGHGNPHGNPMEGMALQYSCLENPLDRGAWRATVHSVARVGTTEVTKHARTESRLILRLSQVL